MCFSSGFARNALRTLITTTVMLASLLVHASSGGLPTAEIPDTGAYQARLIKSKDNVAVIELKGNYDHDLGGSFNVEPRAVIAREFYKSYADRYDILLVFSTFEYNSGDALAFYHGVRNDVRGIGESLFDRSSSYGSHGKLQGFIDMAAMSRYSLEPSSPQFETVLRTIAHEFLHRWAAFVKYRAADGSASGSLLGKEGAHWSFLLDTGGSVEYGHRWQDNGNGTFTSVDARQLYSPLDLYLMGMLKKEEVPPFFLINSQDVDPTRIPEIGVTVKGSKIPLTVDDIIAVEGERHPDATQSQKEFEFGLIVLTRPGEVVTDEQIQAVNRVRQTFQTRLGVMTSGRLIARASLQPKGLEQAITPEQSAPAFPNSYQANIANALSWLKTHQNPAGYWQDNEGTRLRDTTVTLAALRQQTGTDSQQTLAQGWIGNQAPQSTDYLARRSLALDAAQTLNDQQSLLANQNADGGWGIAPGYLSNPIDTALAAQALARNTSTLANTARSKALNFLQQQQNTDGGWSNVKGSTSRTYATTLALNALSDSTVLPPREKAAAFLKNRQNADGGFGDSPSTVHDTANVLAALNATGLVDQIDINAAKHFLNATQRTDGSWDNSAYSTALALNLLGAAGGGNWTLSDFIVTPSSPYDGQRIRLSVRVWNKGTQVTPGTVLRYYDGDPKAGGQAIGNDIVVPALAPGESLLRETLWNTTNRAGLHNLYAYVDPQAQAVESNRNDNQLKTELTVAPAREGLDLALFNTDLLITPGRVNRLPTTVSLTAQISNLGKADAGAVKVALLDSTGLQAIDQQTIILLGRSTVPATFTLALSKAGASRYQIVIDPDNTTADADRSNNSLSVDIPVDPTVDVQILASDIQVPPSNPPTLLGSDVDFKFQLSNNGTADTAPFQAVYTLSNGSETRELGRPQLQLLAGQHRDYTLSWRADLAGELTLKIQLDPLATLSETERNNNQASSAPFTVTAANGANLAVSYHDFSASPSPALEGRELKLSGIVRNTGNQTASNIEIGFYEGDPAKGGVLIAPLQTLPSLAAGASAPVQASITQLKGSQERLYFLVVDPAHKQTELSRDDNSVFLSTDVTPMADLLVSTTDILTIPAQPKAGDSLTLDVGITNIGTQAAEPFVVRLYQGAATQGKQIGNDITVAGLDGQRSTRVSFQTTLPTQGSVIEYTVVADPLEQVNDKTRSNNSATKSLSLQGSDSYVTERYFSPNGDGIKDVTRFGFKLANAGPYRVKLLDAKNKQVREISPSLSGADGQAEWDGKDEFGKVLDDGAYRFELRDKNDSLITQQTVTLDTNRTPILRAMGTAREVYRNLTCAVPESMFPSATNSILEGGSGGEWIALSRSGNERSGSNPLLEVLSLDAAIIQQVDIRAVFEKLKTQDASLESLNKTSWDGWFGVSQSGIQVPVRAAKFGRQLITTVNVTRVYSRQWENAPIGDDIKSIKTTGPEIWMVDLDTGTARILLQQHYPFVWTESEGYSTGIVDYVNIINYSLTGDGKYLHVFVNQGYSVVDGVADTSTWYRVRLLEIPIDHPENQRHLDFEPLTTGKLTWLNPSGYYYRDPISKSGLYGMWYVMGSGGVSGYYLFDFEGRKSNYMSGEASNGTWSSDSKLYAYTRGDREIVVTSANGENAKVFTISGGTSYHLLNWLGRGHLLTFPIFSTSEGNEEQVVFDVDRGVEVKNFNTDVYGYSLADPLSQDFIAGYYNKTNVFTDLSEARRGSSLLLDIDNYRGCRDAGEVCGFTADGRNLLFQSDRDTKDGGVCSLSSGDASQPYTGPNLFAYMSADNLTADIRASRTASGDGFKLRGTAADVNFASYRLDYAPVDQPTDWHPIGVPSTTEKLDAELTQWAPPGAGRYIVRLTVEDLAGNSKRATVRVSTYTTPMITDVYKNEDYISPNGDGVQDTLQIHYRVLDPGHLSFAVFNSQNKRVRLVERAHTEVDQDFTFVWDGRDDKGLVVPDGKYRITVLDYEFAFEVDNTPPVVKAQLSPRAAEKMEFSFSVDESNIKEMRFEQASLGSGDWRVRKGFSQSEWEFYAAQHKGTPGPSFAWDSEHLGGGFGLSDYFDKLNRVAVVDKAGNSVRVEGAEGPRELLLVGLNRNIETSTTKSCSTTWSPGPKAGWGGFPVLGWQLPPLGASFGSVPSLRDTLKMAPRWWGDEFKQRTLYTDFNEIFWRPIVQEDRLTFRDLKDTDNFLQPVELVFKDFQPTVDAAQRRLFRLEYVQWPMDMASALPILPVGVENNVDNLNWQSLLLSAEDFDPLVRQITVKFLVSSPVKEARTYWVRLVATDSDGTTLRSPVSDFFLWPLNSEFSCTGSVAWTIAPNHSSQCGEPPSSHFTLALDPSPELDSLNPDTVNIYRVTDNDREAASLIAQELYRSRPFKLRESTQFIDFSTEGWPVGEQKLLISYEKASASGKGNDTLGSATATFVVDHTSPTLNLVSPGNGAKLCMQHARLDERLVNYLPLEGEVRTQSSAHWQAEILAGDGKDWRIVEPLQGEKANFPLRNVQKNAWHERSIVDPSELLPSSPECRLFGGIHCRVSSPYQWSSEVSGSQLHNQLPISTYIPILSPFTVSYGENVPAGTDFALRRVVDAETLYGRDPVIDGRIQLRTRAFGPSGAEVCTAPIQLDVDGRVLAEAVLGNALFSSSASVPGSVNSARITLTNTELIKARIDVYAGPLSGVGEPTGALVRQLIKDRPFGEGSTELEWDGRDDGGLLAADGVYSIVVVMTDDCQNEKRRSFQVELDNTAPAIALSSPMVGDLIGVRTQVTGSVTDPHFLAYRIDFATEQNAALDLWQPLDKSNTGVSPAKDMYTWRSEVPAGGYVLRVQAQDRAGNVGEVQIPLIKPDLQDVLGEFEVSPSLFSPNGDGRLESVRIAYELLQDAKVTLEARNQDGTLVLATLLDHALVKQGLRYFEWNGYNPVGGARVADGDLIIQITAESASGPVQIQRMRARVRLDATAPVITFEQPGKAWATGKDVARISVSDPLLAASTFYLSVGGSKGPWQVLKESEGAEAKLLGYALGGLEEGAYGLKVVARDQAQNVGEQVFGFELDKTLPKVVLQSPLTGAYISGLKGVTDIQGRVEEKNLARYRLLLGQGAPPPAGTELLSGTVLPVSPSLLVWNAKTVADGPYSLSLVADDLAGNLAQTSVEITVDNTLPVAAFKESARPWYVGRGSVIAGTASDQNFLNYKLEIAPGALGSATRWSELVTSTQAVAAGGTLAKLDALPADGPASLRLTVTDKAGNVSEALTEVLVDPSAPAAPLNLRGQIQNKRDAQLTWDANREPDLAGYAVFRDGVRITPALLTQASYLDAGLAEGRYRYSVKAYDKAGNESGESNVLPLVVSLVQPIASIISPAHGGYASGIAQIKGTASAPSEFREYRLYAGEGAAPANWQLLRRSPAPVMADTLSEWNTLSLREGAIYTLKLESEDLAGNIATDLAPVTIDNRAPAAPLALKAVKNVADVSLDWTASAEPDLQGYLLTRDERIANSSGIVVGSLLPYALSNPAYLDKNVPDGKHAYSVQAMDKAGNLSDRSNIVEVTIDTHPPHVVISKPLTGTAVEQSVYIVGSSDDTDIAKVQYQYRPEGTGAWINLGAALSKGPWAVSWDTTGLALGNYQVRAVATDLGGQTDPAPGVIVLKLTQFDPNTNTRLTGLAAGGSAQLSWTSTDTSNIAGYFIERQTSTGQWQRLNTTMQTVTQYTDTGLSDGDVRYRIQTVVDAAGTLGKFSNEALVHIFTPVLEQPYTPTAQAATDIFGQTLASLDIEVERGGVIQARGQSTAEGAFTLSGVSLPMGDNSFVVRARDAAGNVSRDVAVHVLRATPPATPRNPQTTVSGKDVTLSWQANSESNLLGYVVGNDGVVQETQASISSAWASRSVDSTRSGTQTVDGDPDTGWLAPDLSSLDGQALWLQVNLASKVLLSSVNVLWQAEAIPSAYVLEGYDGQVWVPLLKVRDSLLEAQNLKLAQPYYTDQYRIRILAAAQAPRLNETSARELPYRNALSAGFPALADGMHDFAVRAANTYGLLSEPGSVGRAVGDAQGPAAAVLSAQVSGSDIRLSWTHTNPADVAKYQLWRDGVLIATVVGQSYLDSSLPNAQYSYQVIALDALGNKSPASNTVLAVVDVSGVATQLLLAAVTPDSGARVDLSWQVQSGAIPKTYVLQRGVQAGGPYVALGAGLSVRSYRDATVQNGRDYYYVVQGFDAAGRQIVQSNEVLAHPRDIEPPAAPLFVYPTHAGVLWHTANLATGLRGLSEPGGYVDLSVDGSALQRVAVGAQGSTDSVAHLPFPAYDFDLSADERSLIALANEKLVRYDRASGTTVSLSGVDEAGAVRYAAQGTIAVISGYRSATGYKRGLYLMPQSGTTLLPLGDISPSRNDSYVVSADGTQVVVLGTDPSAHQALWLLDVARGTREELADNVLSQLSAAFALSADGSRLAYVEGKHLRILSLADRSVRETELDAVPTQLSWSAAGDRLYAVLTVADKHRIGVLSLADLGWQYLTPETEDYAQVLASPDGLRYLARKDGTNLVIRSEAGSEWPLAQNVSRNAPVRWSTGGLVHVSVTQAANDIQSLQPPGMFALASTALHVGNNVFGARARDAQGNAGPAGLPITVVVDAGALPDLSILEQDIVVVPGAPLVGEAIQIAVRVHNRGALAKEVPLTVVLSDANGREQLRHEILFEQMEADETRSLVLDAHADAPGVYRVAAQVNAARSIGESSYDNNQAQRAFTASTLASPALTLRTDAARYARSARLRGTVSVQNPGAAFDGKVEVQIEDEAGYRVSRLPDLAVSGLAYAAQLDVPIEWAVGETLAGNYRVAARLYDLSGVLVTEAHADFVVDADKLLKLAATTDKASYTQGEVPRLRGAIDFTAGNAPLASNAMATLSVLDASGIVVAQRSQTLANMLPQNMAAIELGFDTTAVTTGNYQLVLVVREGALVLGESRAEFNIKRVVAAAIHGKLTLDVASIGPGDLLPLSYAVNNSGNAALLAVPLHVRVVSTASISTVQRAVSAEGGRSVRLGGTAELDLAKVDTSVNLDVGSQVNGSARMLPSAGWPLKTLTVVLEAELPGGTQELDRARIAVVDRIPPEVQFLSPAASALLNNFDAPFVVRAREAQTQLAWTEISLDGTNWIRMALLDPAQSTYVINAILPHRDGRYTLYAKAQDVIGNESNLVQLPVIVDTTPPLITLNGVEEGGSYKAEIKPQILVSDANLKSSRVSLDGVAYQAGSFIGQGTHELWVQADDLAGNQSETRIRFSVLLDTPTAVSVVAPAAQSILRTPLSLEAIASSSAGVAQVSLRVDGGVWQAGQAQTGRWVLTLPSLSDGVHLAQAQMETRAGQVVESALRSFTVDNTPPQIVLTGVEAGAIYHAAVQPGYQASDANLDSVTATLDGAPFVTGSTVSVEGNHRLTVKALDKAGNTATRSLDFVLAPLVLSGNLNLSPSAPRAGQTMVLEAGVRNGSQGNPLSVHIEMRVRLAADGSIVTRFAEDAQLAAGSAYPLVRSWQVTGAVGTRYVVQLLATAEGKESVLASQDFVVGDDAADLRLQARCWSMPGVPDRQIRVRHGAWSAVSRTTTLARIRSAMLSGSNSSAPCSCNGD